MQEEPKDMFEFFEQEDIEPTYENQLKAMLIGGRLHGRKIKEKVEAWRKAFHVEHSA